MSVNITRAGAKCEKLKSMKLGQFTLFVSYVSLYDFYLIQFFFPRKIVFLFGGSQNGFFKLNVTIYNE